MKRLKLIIKKVIIELLQILGYGFLCMIFLLGMDSLVEHIIAL